MKIKLAVFLLLLFGIGGSTFAQNNARMLSTPNAQTGTSYTFVAADTTRVVTFSNAGAVAVTLPNGATFGFGAGTMLSVANIGAGTVTITCASCTITANGVTSTSFALAAGGGADIYGGIGNSAVNYVALPSPSGANIPLLNANNVFTGNNTFGIPTGVLTFSNHNAMFWAGPGATPTIDQAVASCGANPCWVEISPLYTGVESANLLTLSTGHKVYSGALNVTISDRRGNIAGSQPNYPVLYGGRLAGQLVRMGVNQWSGSPTDSTGAGTNFNWITGTMPSTGGTQNGSVSVAISHDSVTESTFNVPYVGQDGECDVTATTFDIPHNFCYGVNGQTNIIRANGAQSVTNAVGLHAAVNSNVSSAGAVFVNNYGAYLEAQSGGTSRNYSLYSLGNNLTANETQLHALDVGTAFTITAITEVGQTVTVTTSVVCSLVANQQVAIAGVTNTNYNGTFFVVSPCGGGSTFTYIHPAQASLAASSAGTATGSTPRIMAYYRNTNAVEYRPLADAVGWNWNTQGGAGILTVNSAVIVSRVNHQFSLGLLPSAAGGSDVGSTSLPWANLWLGTAGTNNFKFQPAATAAARVVSMPDPGTNVNMAFNLTATSAAFATATTAATCVQSTTAVTGATTAMVAEVSPVSTPGVGAVWSAFVSSAGNVTINECAVAASAGGSIAFNIRVHP